MNFQELKSLVVHLFSFDKTQSDRLVLSYFEGDTELEVNMDEDII